jgi:molybdopterin-guanine dinucleotide biosynthesis protein A
MGKDKARLQLGGQTMLRAVRKAAAATGLPTRVLRKDVAPGCGPLGGLYTALKGTTSDSILFLACDMPLITPALLRSLLEAAGNSSAWFVTNKQRIGFPFLLTRSCLQIVERNLERGNLSLASLANALRAKLIRVPARHTCQLFNVNTPADFSRACALVSKMSK